MKQHMRFLVLTCDAQSQQSLDCYQTLIRVGHYKCAPYIIWASTLEKMSSVVCEQPWRRPACASAQSDQRLCFFLIGKNHI